VRFDSLGISIGNDDFHSHRCGDVIRLPRPLDLFAGSSLPLLLVNQNCVVMSGSMNASNTSATGRRMSIPVFMTGACVRLRLSFVFLVVGEIATEDGPNSARPEQRRARTLQDPDTARHERRRTQTATAAERRRYAP